MSLRMIGFVRFRGRDLFFEQLCSSCYPISTLLNCHRYSKRLSTATIYMIKELERDCEIWRPRLSQGYKRGQNVQKTSSG